MKAVVIGGGWAGIAAAMEAARRGWRVHLVEERPYLGGRARSFTDRTTGDVIDNGQHVMMGCYHQLLHIVHDLGTDHLLERQKALRVAFVDESAGLDVLDASVLPGKLGMLLGLLRLRKLPLSARIAIVRLALKVLRTPNAGMGLTCHEFFHQVRQPGVAVQRFWEPLVLATLNAPVSDAPADLLSAVLRLAFFGTTNDAKLLIPTGGLSDLVAPFETWLAARGGTVRTSTSVDRVTIVDGRAAGVVLSDGSNIDVDVVISAVPQRALARLMLASGIVADLPEEPEMSPIVSAYLWYDRQWMSVDFAAAIGTTVQWVFNKQRTTEGLVALTVSAASDIVRAPSEEIIRSCDVELQRLFAGTMGSAVLKHGVVIKEKLATPRFSPAAHGLRPTTDALHTHVRNLFLAGDWTQTQLPATLEGAARSGVAAIAAAHRVS
ncbi:MAG: FAD-dependent oxidoreductase [Candidatus Kapabacteria bacterium]|nr:FAD-dependent oxidoreductase [Candidatus Kapabacteria bacterium]